LLLLAVLFFTVAVNVFFIVETSKRSNVDDAKSAGVVGVAASQGDAAVSGDGRPDPSERLTKSRRSNQLKLQASSGVRIPGLPDGLFSNQKSRFG
jgi:hypothetical protein